MNKLIAVMMVSSLALAGYLVAGDGECSKAAAGTCAKEQAQAKGTCGGESKGTCPMQAAQAKGVCSESGKTLQADANAVKADAAKAKAAAKTVKADAKTAKPAKVGDQAAAK